MIRLFALVVCLGLAACAQPKYSAQGSGGALPSHGEAGGGCQAKFSDGHCVEITWETLPTETDFGSFLFKTFRPNLADGSPMPVDLEGDLAVVLWMPSMGHGSSPVTVDRLDVGTYRASKVFFSMKGNWEIRVELKNAGASTLKDQAVVPLSL